MVPLMAGTVSLAPVQDTTLIETGDGSLADARGPYLRVGRTNQGTGSSIRRALLTFDVAGSVPRGARVVSATLILYKFGGTPGPIDVTLHRVTADWGEGSSSFGGGQGAPATPGDATWLHRFHNPAAVGDSPSWSDPGGDFEAASASSTIGGSGYYAWSDPQMVDDVRSWLKSPPINPGWVLIGDETSGGSVQSFTSQDNDTAAQHPLLLVEYTSRHHHQDDEDSDEDED